MTKDQLIDKLNQFPGNPTIATKTKNLISIVNEVNLEIEVLDDSFAEFLNLPSNEILIIVI